MKSLAIIGTGIAGMACGYRLHKEYHVTVYEKNRYAGGHTNAVDVEEEARLFPIDTGFIVYNEVNYPQLTQLFRELGVASKPAPMSFSVQHEPTGLEFCGSGWSGLFAQRKNIFNSQFWRLLKEINRFNKECLEVLDNPRYAEITLQDYAMEKGFHLDLLEKYLIPMSSAVWSTRAETMLRFPAATLVHFFKNHGFLGLYTQHAWRTVDGSSRQYRNKIIESYRDRIQLGNAAVQIARDGDRVNIRDASGQSASYDAVIVATHADQALRLLAQPTKAEEELLGAFDYQKNAALLHTDESVMPKTRRAWSSWNWWTGVDTHGAPQSSTIYWMNSLQGLPSQKNYFLSMNDPGRVQPRHRLREIEYEHPIFSVEAIRAQKRLPELNEKGPIYFCGSYFRYGFHEDALVSALAVCNKLGSHRTQVS